MDTQDGTQHTQCLKLYIQQHICFFLFVLLWLLTGSLCGLVCNSRLEQRPHIYSSSAHYHSQP